MAAQRLAADEALALDARQRVEGGRQQQEDGGDDEAGRLHDDAQPLHQAHHEVDDRAHVVGLEAADERVELGRGRADVQQQRDLDEDDEERADAEGGVSQLSTYTSQTGVLQADDAEGDDGVGVEDVGDAQREAQDDTQHARPRSAVSSSYII